MTQLNVQMSLTLADAASGPLRAFSEGLAALKAQTAGVSQRLEAIAVGITNVSKAAAGAQTIGALSGNLGALAAAMTGVRTASTGVAGAIGNIGNRASAAGVGTYALEQAMGALGGTLSGIVARLTATAAGLGAIGTEARAAGAGVRAGMAGMEGGMVAANSQASTLMTTLKGLGMLYAALKIEKGLKASALDAIEFQNTQTRLTNMNVGAEGKSALMSAADATSRDVPQFSRNQTLEMGIDLRNATGSIEHAIEMLTPFAKAAYDMKMATPAGQTFNDRDMLLIAKALEQRNATMEPAKMQAELDMMTKIYAATQGRVNAQQMLGNLQYAKGGLGQSLDLSFMPMLAAMIEQIKSGGGNGGQIGTSLTSLQQSVLNGTGNGQAQKERARLGLLDADKLVWNNQGNVDQQKSDLRMAGAEQFQRNPYEWVQNILKPAMLRAGIDLTNDAAVNQTLNRLFPNRNAANIASTMINRGPLLEKDAANINQTADSRAQYETNIKTAQANIDAFKAQLANLGIVLGTTLLPAITVVAKALTSMFEGMAAFFQANPVAATFFSYAAAIGAVTLAIAGFAAVFGIASGMLTTLLGFVRVPAIFSLAGAAVRTFAAVVGIGLSTLTGVVVAFFAGWELGGWIANLNIGGQQVKDWGADLIEWVVNAFRKGWNTIGAIVSSIIPGARAAAVEGMGGPRTGGASGSWDKPAPSTGGASGSWDAPTHSGSGRGSYAGYNAQADAASKGRSTKAGLFKPARAPSGDDEEAITGSRSGSGGRGGRGGAGRFANYDAALDDAKNAYRLEEAEMKRHLKTMDEEYKAGLLSVDAFFADKLATATKTITAEIAILEREKAAYAKQGDKAGVNRVKTDIDIKRIGLAETTDQIAAEKKAAINRLDKDAIDLQRALLQTSGQRHAAELLHLQQEMKAKIDLLLLNGKITQGEADAMLARSKAAVDFQESYKQLAPLQEKYAERLAEIDRAERNGTLSRTAAEDQKLALMKQEATEIDVLIVKWREMAVAAGDDKALLALDKLKSHNQSVEDQLPAADTEYLKATQTGFEGIFKAVISGSESGKTAIEKFAQSMNNTLLNLISKRLGDALFDSIFGGTGTGGKGGGGGGGLFGGLFGGGGGGGGLFGGGGGGGGLLGSLFSQYGAEAMTSLGFGSGMVGFNQLAGAGINVAGAGYSAAADSAAAWNALALLDVGTNYVPQDMLAMIHKGEAVVPAAYNVEAGRQGGNQRPINYSPTFILDQPQSRATQSQVATAALRGAQRVLARGNA